MEKVWGSTLSIPWNAPRYEVSPDAEIAPNNFVYITTGKHDAAYSIINADWLAMVNGDLSIVKDQIESQIQGTKCVWIKVSWDYFYLDQITHMYAVKGFQIEAVVQNISAGLTGLEIVAIIAAVGFLVAIITACAITSWAAYEIINEFGGSGALVVFILAGVGLLLLLGVSFSLSGSKSGGSLKAGRK